MSQYDTKIMYVRGENNMIADALSCLPVNAWERLEAAATYAYISRPWVSW